MGTAKTAELGKAACDEGGPGARPEAAACGDPACNRKNVFAAPPISTLSHRMRNRAGRRASPTCRRAWLRVRRHARPK